MNGRCGQRFFGWGLLLIILCSLPSGASSVSVGTTVGSVRASGDRMTECAARALQLKDCDLKLGSLQIGINKQRWRLNDGVWRMAHDLPLTGEKTAWEAIRLRRLGGRPLLEFLIWGEPKGEAEVQPLHWYVVEVVNQSAELRVQQVIQYRRVLHRPEGQAIEYQLDPRETYGLKLAGGKRITWRSGRSSGSF